MIKLKSFSLSGVGRFVDKQTIDFTKLGSLVQVDAENKNTGGSSGSGKTTIFHALEYNLGINDLPTSVLQSRLTENGIYTLGEYEVDGKELKILRSKSKFSIEFDGETTSGSSKITEEKLDEILGMDRKLFRPMLHKRQKEGGFFLDFTPAKMNEFLTSALGLGEYRSKIETIDAKIKNLSESLQKASSSKQAAQAGLDASYSAMAALGSAPVVMVRQDQVDQLKSEWTRKSVVWNDIEERHKYALADLEGQRPQVSVSPFDRTQIEAFERGISILRQKAELLSSDERDRVAAVNKQLSDARLEQQKAAVLAKNGEKSAREALVIAEEIKKLRASLCPTCEQGWATDAAKAKEASLITQLRYLKGSVAAGQTAQTQLATLESKINDFQSELPLRSIPEVDELKIKMQELSKKIEEERVKEKEHLSTQNAAHKAILAEFTAKHQALVSAHNAESAAAHIDMATAKYAYEGAVRKISEETENLTRHRKMISTLETQIDNYQNNVNGLTTSISDIQAKLEVAEEVKKAIKSYVSCSFDDALEQVGDTATRILRAIPNMANATVQFDGLKENKDGKIKEEVNASISLDGEIGIPIRSLSGGERSAVDLAVDLAVIDLLENKTNKGIDVFILDEPFTGLDTVSIEMALEVLKNSSINKKLVIVDHNPEVKQMVESRLVVVRDGIASKIEQG